MMAARMCSNFDENGCTKTIQGVRSVRTDEGKNVGVVLGSRCGSPRRNTGKTAAEDSAPTSDSVSLGAQGRAKQEGKQRGHRGLLIGSKWQEMMALIAGNQGMDFLHFSVRDLRLKEDGDDVTADVMVGPAWQ